MGVTTRRSQDTSKPKTTYAFSTHLYPTTGPREPKGRPQTKANEQQLQYLLSVYDNLTNPGQVVSASALTGLPESWIRRWMYREKRNRKQGKQRSPIGPTTPISFGHSEENSGVSPAFGSTAMTPISTSTSGESTTPSERSMSATEESTRETYLDYYLANTFSANLSRDSALSGVSSTSSASFSGFHSVFSSNNDSSATSHHENAATDPKTHNGPQDRARDTSAYDQAGYMRHDVAEVARDLRRMTKSPTLGYVPAMFPLVPPASAAPAHRHAVYQGQPPPPSSNGPVPSSTRDQSLTPDETRPATPLLEPSTSTSTSSLTSSSSLLPSAPTLDLLSILAGSGFSATSTSGSLDSQRTGGEDTITGVGADTTANKNDGNSRWQSSVGSNLAYLSQLLKEAEDAYTPIGVDEEEEEEEESEVGSRFFSAGEGRGLGRPPSRVRRVKEIDVREEEEEEEEEEERGEQQRENSPPLPQASQSRQLQCPRPREISTLLHPHHLIPPYPPYPVLPPPPPVSVKTSYDKLLNGSASFHPLPQTLPPPPSQIPSSVHLASESSQGSQRYAVTQHVQQDQGGGRDIQASVAGYSNGFHSGVCQPAQHVHPSSTPSPCPTPAHLTSWYNAYMGPNGFQISPGAGGIGYTNPSPAAAGNWGLNFAPPLGSVPPQPFSRPGERYYAHPHPHSHSHHPGYQLYYHYPQPSQHLAAAAVATNTGGGSHWHLPHMGGGHGAVAVPIIPVQKTKDSTGTEIPRHVHCHDTNDEVRVNEPGLDVGPATLPRGDEGNLVDGNGDTGEGEAGIGSLESDNSV